MRDPKPCRDERRGPKRHSAPQRAIGERSRNREERQSRGAASAATAARDHRHLSVRDAATYAVIGRDGRVTRSSRESSQTICHPDASHGIVESEAICRTSSRLDVKDRVDALNAGADAGVARLWAPGF
jgi:hypothetical protein